MAGEEHLGRDPRVVNVANEGEISAERAFDVPLAARIDRRRRPHDDVGAVTRIPHRCHMLAELSRRRSAVEFSRVLLPRLMISHTNMPRMTWVGRCSHCPSSPLDSRSSTTFAQAAPDIRASRTNATDELSGRHSATKFSIRLLSGFAPKTSGSGQRATSR